MGQRKNKDLEHRDKTNYRHDFTMIFSGVSIISGNNNFTILGLKSLCNFS